MYTFIGGDFRERATGKRIVWDAWYWYLDEYGRRKRKRKGGFTSEAKAKAYLKSIEANCKAGTFGAKPKQVLTFGAFVERYERNVLASRRPGTRDRNMQAARRFMEFMGRGGKVALDAITPEHIEAFGASELSGLSRRGRSTKTGKLARNAKPLKPATVVRHIESLRGMFAAAVRWKLLTENPVSGVPKPRIPQRGVVFLEADEQGRLVEACGSLNPTAQARTPFLQPLVILALYTGMRKGELFHLRWRDVDFAARRIHVRNDGDHQTKSGKERVVGLHDEAARALEGWREWFAAEMRRAEALGRSKCALRQARAARRLEILRRCAPRPDGLVFPSFHAVDEAGEPLVVSNVDTGLQSALAAAGIPRERIGLHVLRHTFAVNLCRAEVPIYKISKLLGHADTRTTEQHYLRFAKDEAADVVGVLEGL